MFHKLPEGKNIYYEFFLQNNESKTLVFLNGLSQSTFSWQPFAKAFENRYNVLLLDNVFQGQSDKTGEWRSFEQHAADLKSLIDFLGLRQIFLAGISYGGAVAQRFMFAYPETVEKAILMSTFAHKTPYFNVIGDSWKRSLEAGGYGLMLDVMLPIVLSPFYFVKPLVPIEVMRGMRTAVNDEPEALLKLMRATEESEDFRPKLEKIAIPTLVIQGQNDPLTTPQMGKAIANSLQNAEFVAIKRKGHTLNLEAIPECIELIGKFLL